MAVPLPGIFVGGQMTDLPAFPNTSFDGTELFEVVWGSDGTAATALNYRIPSNLLAGYLQALQSGFVIINIGEHTDVSDPYIVPFGVGRVYVNKAVAEPTFVRFQNVSGYPFDVIVADIAGTAEPAPSANLITITFSSAQKASNNSTITIENPYGGWAFRPVYSILNGVAMWLLGSA